MKTETLLKLIQPAIASEQQITLDRLLSAGHTFHSLFHDGSLELFSPEPEKRPVYIERNGDAFKYKGGKAEQI